jgi:hypothetical protein
VLHIEYELDERTREGVCALLDQLAKWGGPYLRNSLGKSPAAGSTPSLARHRDGDIQSLFLGVTMTVPRYSLDLSHAPVDGDFAACHEAGIIGREEEHRRCDFFG